MAQVNYPSIPPLKLKTRVSTTDSTFKLQNINWYTGSDGAVVELAVSNFGSNNKGYGCFEPGTARQEFFEWDTSTLASYATGITINLRGLIPSSPYTTEASTRKFTHAGNTSVLLFTNAPEFYASFANKENDETITGTWTFTNTDFPKLNSYTAPTNNEDFAPKKYVDDTAIAGAPAGTNGTAGIYKSATATEIGAGTATDGTYEYIIGVNDTVKTSSGAGDENKLAVLNASGQFAAGFVNVDATRTWSTVQSFTADNLQITSDANSANDAVRTSLAQQGIALGTSGEAFSVGQGLYVKASDGKLYKSLGTGDESTYSFVGIAIQAATGADETIRFARPGGIASGLSSLTAGSYYFVTDTAGTLGTTPGTRYAKVGQALTTTTMRVIEPKFIRRGSTTISGTGTTAVTTGFYPAHVELRAGAASAAARESGISIGDDTNTCIRASVGQTTFAPYSGSLAWSVYHDDGDVNAGTISAKSQTSFTLNCTTAQHNAEIYWVAYSG